MKDILEHFVSPYGNLLTFIITIWAIQSYCNPNSQLSLKVILREIVLVLAIILICIRFYAIEELVYYDKDAAFVGASLIPLMGLFWWLTHLARKSVSGSFFTWLLFVFLILFWNLGEFIAVRILFDFSDTFLSIMQIALMFLSPIFVYVWMFKSGRYTKDTKSVGYFMCFLWSFGVNYAYRYAIKVSDFDEVEFHLWAAGMGLVTSIIGFVKNTNFTSFI